jgi:tetratricopeptide (TPR) repeat protein
MLGPGGTFDDRMLYLRLLGTFKRPEYWWFIAQLGADLPEKDENLVTLLSWMNNNGLARLTLMWTDELPTDRSERVPVCVAIAEAHALLGNWGKLKSLLRFQKWGELEFQREALTARVLREESGDETGARSHWAAAVALAGERREALSALGRFAVTWKWEEEYTNLLWVIANGRDQPAVALQQLMKKYTAEGKTRDLLRVFNRMLELDPQNIETKNNIAYALLILGMEPERAQMLAYEVRASDSSNPEYSSTYALALHSKGKSDTGLKVLQQLSEKDKSAPSTALCFGVLSAAAGLNEDAIKYLDAAEKGPLLPEEKTLAQRTREKIPR